MASSGFKNQVSPYTPIFSLYGLIHSLGERKKKNKNIIRKRTRTSFFGEERKL